MIAISGRSPNSLRPVTQRLRRTTALSLVLGAVAGTALAGPQGGVVVGGNAQINQAGRVTDVNQNTANAIIDWQSFNVGQQDTVNFNQPSTSAITLNRVRSGAASAIEGRVNAPGNVWVVNPQGVMITQTAQINVGGFLASTADIDNADFMSGNYLFDQPGDPDASVVNEGRITFGEAGLVGLVAPNAENVGVIAGKLGKVRIAGTDAFAIDLAGDGILALPTGEATALKASNTGTISNQGGYVLIDAATAEGVLESSVFGGGVIEATSFAEQDGRIVLSAGSLVEVAGEINVTGQTGGDIVVTGDLIDLQETASLDVSGDLGGGTIRVGGDVRGGGTIRTAKRTRAAEGSALRADAITSGDGGSIVLFSDEATGFYGSVSAIGGSTSGNGGFVEVSADFVDVRGSVDLSAVNGERGTFLIDPLTITITGEANVGGTDILFDDDSLGVDTFLDPSYITDVDGSLILEAVNQINVNEVVNNLGTGNTLDLTLESGGGISINQDLLINGSITLQSGSTDFPGSGAFEGILLNAFTDLSATGALDVTVGLGQTFALGNFSTITAGAGLILPDTQINRNATINVSGGNLTQAAGTGIIGFFNGEGFEAGTLTALAGTNDILLTNDLNALDGFNAVGDDIDFVNTTALTDASTLTINSITASGNVDILTDDALSFVDADGGSITGTVDYDIIGTADFEAGGDITSGFDAIFDIGDDASFQALDDGGDADVSNDQFFEVELDQDNTFGGTLSLVGDIVEIFSVGDLDIVDSYAAISLDVTVDTGDASATRVFTGAFDGSAGPTATIATGGSITIRLDDGGFTGSDLFADTISIRGEPDEGPDQPIVGDVVIDDFEAQTSLQIGDVTGAITLSDGSAPTLTLGGSTDLSLTSVDFTTTPSVLTDGTVYSGTVRLNGVRPSFLDFSAGEVELGFVEVAGFIDITTSGSIVKVSDADLEGGQGADATIDAPDLPLNSGGTAGIITDRTVDTGADFANLISVDGTTTFVTEGTTSDILLPHGETSNGAVHNDFGTVLVEGTFLDIVIEDANDIDVFSNNFFGDLDAETVVIRADSDFAGDDGDIVFGLNTSGTATLLTTGDIDAFGDFGTGLILQGDDAFVTLDGPSPIIDSRLTGDLEIGVGSSMESEILQIDVIDTEVGGDLSIVNSDFFFGGEGDGEFDGEFQPLAIDLPPGINASLDRVAVGGDLSIQADDSIGISDTQVTGNATLGAETIIAERFFVGGDLTNFDDGQSTIIPDTLSLTDAEIGGDLVFDAFVSIVGERVQVGGTSTSFASESITFSDFIFDGATDFGSSILDFDTGAFGTSTAFSDQTESGFSLRLVNVEVQGDLDTGAPSDLTMSRVATIGDMTVVAPGAFTSSNLSATGDASFTASSFDLSNVDINGIATFSDSASLALVDAAFGTLNFGVQVGFDGTRIFARNGIDGETTGGMIFIDLQSGGVTNLAAGGALTIDSFVLSTANLSGGTLFLENGIASSAFTAPFPVEITSDGTETLFFAGDPVDFTVLGAGEVLLPGAIADLADITGPGDGADVNIGLDVNSQLGDTVLADRVIGVSAAVDGRAGASGNDDLGTRAALDDVAVVFEIEEEPEIPVIPEVPEVPEIPEEQPIGRVGEIVNNPIDEQEAPLTLDFFDFTDPVFELPTVDFGTLFSATGNENLWSGQSCTGQGDTECN